VTSSSRVPFTCEKHHCTSPDEDEALVAELASPRVAKLLVALWPEPASDAPPEPEGVAGQNGQERVGQGCSSPAAMLASLVRSPLLHFHALFLCLRGRRRPSSFPAPRFPCWPAFSPARSADSLVSAAAARGIQRRLGGLFVPEDVGEVVDAAGMGGLAAEVEVDGGLLCAVLGISCR